MTNDLYLTQVALEKESRSMTIQRFESDLTDKKQDRQEASTFYGKPLMKRAIEPMLKRITEVYAEAETGGTGKRLSSIQFMKMLEPDVLAFISAKIIIDRITSKNRLQDVAMNAGNAIEDEVRYESFNAAHPALFYKINKETDAAGSDAKRKRTILVAAYNRYCLEWNGWSQNDKLHLGMKMIEIFQQSTGFVEVVETRSAKNKTDKLLVATQTVCDFMEKNHGLAQLLSPLYMPMVVPPAQWTGPRGGGYLTHHTRPLTLIKTANRNYLDELEGLGEQLEPVYAAVNAIQETSWQVNEFVLVTFQMIHDQGLAVGGLSSLEQIPLPPAPFVDRDTSELSEEEKAAFKIWKAKAKAVYVENIRLKSKRLMTSKIRSIAEKFSIYESIYFPHTLDFRGRAYPTAMYLNPQGNSLAKGLLRFADGKPLGTNEAACELAIHGANCFGYDKASMQERVDWVVKNQDRILQAGTAPLDDLWWAKEADDAWSFLAFCNEWVGYCQDGYDHVSYIPCAKDGSCSGLQHFSAALRDPVGGAAVSLIPSDRPSDIYQAVIDLTKKKVHADLRSTGYVDEKETITTRSLAKLWLEYGMTRKTSKRCTMTRVYGSTLFSARKFIQEYITETDAKRTQEDASYVSVLDGYEFLAAVYLAKHVWESINQTVIAAKDGMDWLQESAKVLAKQNLPIVWTTVDGLPVMQNYLDMSKRRVKTKFGDKLIYLTLQEPKENKLDSRRQGNGISPNWVHANDGCHLRMSVNLAKANGVTHFGMIHDSFSCHAADVEMFGACLREAFIDLYEHNNPLQLFKSQAEAQSGLELPPLPATGDLDITQVRHSEFFFA